MKCRVWITGIMLCLAIGCGRNQEATPVAEAPVVEEGPGPVELFLQSCRVLAEAQKTNELEQALLAGLDDEALSDAHAAILNEMMGTRVMAGDIAAAQELFKQKTADNRALLTATFGRLERYLLQNGQLDIVVPWCREFTGIGRPESVRAIAYGTILDALRRQNEMGELMMVLPEAMKALSPEAASGVARQLMHSMLGAKDYASLARVAALMQQDYAKVPGIPETVEELMIRGLIGQSLFADAAARYEAALGILGDATISSLFSRYVSEARTANALDEADALASRMMAREETADRLLNAVARQWIILAKDQGKAGEVSARLKQVLPRIEAPEGRVGMINTVFHYLMTEGPKEDRAAMIGELEALRGQVSKEGDQSRVALLILDGCFMTDDFGRALRTMEVRVAGRDDAWHELLTVKIKAHKSLAEGDIPGAVSQFREFMKIVKASEPEAVEARDPSSGLWVSREEVLGLNAKRIADLWTSVNETDKAAAALGEARTHYQEAFESAKEGSKEKASLATMLEQFPAEAP